MTEASFFENDDLLWPVALIGMVLWVVFIWKEWKNPVSKQCYLHILIAFIAILSFAMIALKPLINSEKELSIAVLLTDGYSKSRLDSLQGARRGIKVIPYKENFPFSETLDSLSSIYVLGNGVASYDFWQFKNRPVEYLGAEVPTGIVQLVYAKENVIGSELSITGNYSNSVAKHQLVLQDENGAGLDSVLLDSKKAGFSLKTPLKATGKFVLKITEKDSLGDQISSNPIPLTVTKDNFLKILIINKFPTFETKYLKNYLGEMGHEVVVRSQLTKGRYKFEYFNTSKTPIYNLDESILTNFDLLIIDATSFKNTSQSVKRSLEKVVKNEGLGIFIQPEISLFNLTSKQLSLKFKRDPKSKVNLDGFPKVALEKFPFEFEKSDGLETIHSANGSVFTAYKRLEKGRVGATVFQNTYQLQLNGKTDVYKEFWSQIIGKLAKKNDQELSWLAADNFPLINQPYHFQLYSKTINPQVRTNDGNRIALRQDVDIPSLWSGTTYPLKQKWNKIKVHDIITESLDFYVIDSLEWQSLRAFRQQKENKRFFSNPPKVKQHATSTKVINPFWFFGIGLLSLSYLWLHPKLNTKLS